ncbi:hypothetical protein F5146DRAFT_1069569 [Armillaria mellea]|nr:hypothetical protein F5146DRAFT_1069569 [Armillaria mellea]
MPEDHACHGYPLWTPEPDYSLPPAYVGKGICVGDVGIIRDDGGFDFIFNAFLEPNDPVHACGVPPNFSPLRIESLNPIRTIYFQHPRDSSVRSSHVSVKSVTLEASTEVPSIAGGGAGFEFTTSKDQAAVLMLPQGGTRFDHKYLSSMRNYALEHAHEWYEYINDPDYLGREALNGSLCFVTGCDKTTTWGSAAMSRPSDTRQFLLRFLVRGLSDGRIALRSSWSTQEWTDTRLYPDQDIGMDASLPARENQAVFIRGFTISVREKSRTTKKIRKLDLLATSAKMVPGFGQRPGGVQLVAVSGKSGNSPVIGSKAPYSDQRHASPPASAPVWTGNGNMIRGAIEGNELMQLQISIVNAHMGSFGESHQPESTSDYPPMSSIPYGGTNIPVASQLSSDGQDHVVLQYFPERSTKVPESDVVITHDSAWIFPMLEKEGVDVSSHPDIHNQESIVADVSMAPEPEHRESPSLKGSRSSRGTPTHRRRSTREKTGCWTCRVRRKKCDEQWKGDSCQTCVHLNIECLGWGPKPPEWMHDKQAVEAYQKSIKDKLSDTGIIRRQFWTSMQQARAAEPAPPSRPPTFHRLLAPSLKTSEKSSSTASSSSALHDDLQRVGYRFDPPRMGGMPRVPGPSNDFHQLPATSYSDSNVNSMVFGTSSQEENSVVTKDVYR